MSKTLLFADQSLLYEALISTHPETQNKAFNYLYQELYGSFLFWVKSNSGSDSDAEDAFQKGILNFFLNVKSGKYTFQEGAKVTYVVFDYCKKVWYNVLSSKGFKSKGEMPAGYESVEISDSESEQEERMSAVEWGLEKLGGSCAKIIRWYYIDRLSLKEIAELLGITLPSAKDKKYKCMQKLKEILKDVFKD